jgi:AcrR family transcriptional regulator
VENGILSRAQTRTRNAIIRACRDMIGAGARLSLRAVAEAALVSEATAYRYFPDLLSLLREALAGAWNIDDALAPIEDCDDPVERVGFACEVFLRHVQACQSAIRVVVAATVTQPEFAAARPGHRFPLIDRALAPFEEQLAAKDPEAMGRLKNALAAIISPESLFCFTDLLGLPAQAGIDNAVHMARLVTADAFSGVRE